MKKKKSGVCQCKDFDWLPVFLSFISWKSDSKDII